MTTHTCRSDRPPRLLRWCALAVVLAAAPCAARAQVQPAPTADTPTADAKPGFLPEPHIISRGIDFLTRTEVDGSSVKSGPYLELSNLPTGSGWISAGPGYRRWLAHDSVVLDASAAVSWRMYKMAQARVELPRLAGRRLTLGAQVRWQDLTQVTYFGDGPATLAADRSEYRLKSGNVLGYAVVRPRQWLALTGRAGWLPSPSLLRPGGTFARGNPATQDLFAADPVFTMGPQPAYGYGEASAAIDRRDHRSHPTTGGVYRIAWAAYSDRDAGTFSFRRSEAEAAQFVPLANGRVVLAAHGWLVASDTSAGRMIPFYLQTSLGGGNTLRGYPDFRFHGRNALVMNLEARVSLMTHVDAALFADGGNVAGRLSDLDLAKRSYGVGLRLHSHQTTFARVDVAHGDEGWRVQLRMNDPLHLTRLTRRTAAIPVVP